MHFYWRVQSKHRQAGMRTHTWKHSSLNMMQQQFIYPFDGFPLILHAVVSCSEEDSRARRPPGGVGGGNRRSKRQHTKRGDCQSVVHDSFRIPTCSMPSRFSSCACAVTGCAVVFSTLSKPARRHTSQTTCQCWCWYCTACYATIPVLPFAASLLRSLSEPRNPSTASR